MGRKEELRKLEKTESVCLKKLNRDLPPGPVRGGGGGADRTSKIKTIHYPFLVLRLQTAVCTCPWAPKTAGCKIPMLFPIGLKTSKWLKPWQQPWWFLKIHNRKCNYPPPSQAVHQKQRSHNREARAEANASVYPHIERLCIFSFSNGGQEALPTAHTGGRRLKKEGADKMSPSSQLYTMGIKNEWKPSR